MLSIRKAAERGKTQLDWLDSSHSFSFGWYRDPAHMGYRGLRVINDDLIAPGGGFDTHGHRDMEIISYVVEGAMAHRDSLGNGSVIRAGEVQRMTAGTGITHSEFNHSQSESLRLLQIWILPRAARLEPGYEQEEFDPAARRNRLQLLVSPDGKEGSLRLHQDAKMYGAIMDGGETLTLPVKPGRGFWLQVVKGDLQVSGHELQEGDGLAAEDAGDLAVSSREGGEFLWFDLA